MINFTGEVPSTVITIFGATGDLTRRKLIPAVWALWREGLLPRSFAVLGTARTVFTDQQFRDTLRSALDEQAKGDFPAEEWDVFAGQIFYQPLDITKEDDFVKLGSRLEMLNEHLGGQSNHLYYFATAPDFFANLAAQLFSVGLVAAPSDASKATRAIIEKPFGHDLPSARALNIELKRYFSEQQIFRIDHYLGKETVQNILVLRFANEIFEPLWNYRYVDHIQISVCEEVGVGSRAGYFDQAGTLRDMVQNHVAQMLSLLCIEPPISLLDPETIRDEKVKVLRSVRRFAAETVAARSVRAQYTAGAIRGSAVPGYLEEPNVAVGSTTETFVALRIEIDNWRWVGVPIFVRVGKRMPVTRTEISVYFRPVPASPFKGASCCRLDQNVLTIEVQPKEGVSLTVNFKPPGLRMQVEPVDLNFAYESSFKARSPAAYERLLLDAMRGDATLFARSDEIEQAWDITDSVIGAWHENGLPLEQYSAGSYGPPGAHVLTAAAGCKWRRG